jgi:hypothetical protein
MLRSASSSVVFQPETLMRIASCRFQVVGPHQRGSVCLYGGDEVLGGLVVAGGDKDLVEHHVVEDVQPCLRQSLADAAGVAATGAVLTYNFSQYVSSAQTSH